MASKTLVVVESPAKAKTIEKYLGKGYIVKASKGHIVDLPKSGLGVDVDNGFKPEYKVMLLKNKVIKELKAAFVGADKLVLAVDPDREGEAIGWHIANKLGLIDLNGKRKNPEIGLERIVFTEITKQAIQEAINNPRKLDNNLLLAQQTRRILDRLVGYKLSPMLWKKIRFGLSAGRVQSVAVKFIVDREKERDAHIPEEYWRVFIYAKIGENNVPVTGAIILQGNEQPVLSFPAIKFELLKKNDKKFSANSQLEIEKILASLKVKNWKIDNKEAKISNRYPKPPFTTSTLQQTAANWFGFSAKKTMTIAQKLYEAGQITYMRTDSTNLSAESIKLAREYIVKNLSKKYLPNEEKHYKTKAKVAQEAHEAIRPTNFVLKPEDYIGEADFAKLYTLIWQRALASQMENAQIEGVTLTSTQLIDEDKYEFKASGQTIIFPGYLKIYPEKVTELEMPDTKIGDKLALDNLFSTQHFTQPPARFSEASLIKELEKYGIGRPSTYAPIISTIQQRGYVEKEANYFKPTDTGIIVTKLLSTHFAEIVDKDFTASMEDDLDAIANGEKKWDKILESFYTPFAKKLLEKEGEINREDFTVLADAPEEIKCPICGSKMLLKLGRFGRFYSCSRFPECKGILSLSGKTEEEIMHEADTAEFKEKYLAPPKTEDNRDFILKTGRFGQFWAHPDYPKVKDAKPLEYTRQKLLELFGEIPKTNDGQDFLLRAGKFGQFWAHPDYPKIKETIRIKKSQIATVESSDN